MKAIFFVVIALSTSSHAEWGTGVEIGTLCPYPMSVAAAAVDSEKISPLYKLNPYRTALPGYYNPGPNYGTAAGAIGHGAFGCDSSVVSTALANPWLAAGPNQENALLNAGWAPIDPDDASKPSAVPMRGLASDLPTVPSLRLEWPEFGRRPRAGPRLLLLENR